MLLIDLIHHVFVETGRRWKMGDAHLIPNEDSIQATLDEAARILYDREVGQSITMGGLVFEKTREGTDVYVYVGEYK